LIQKKRRGLTKSKKGAIVQRYQKNKRREQIEKKDVIRARVGWGKEEGVNAHFFTKAQKAGNIIRRTEN